MLEIRLLGRFELKLNGCAIELRSRPAQSLLAYLLLHRGAAHRRERLAGLFWPAASKSSARRSLRQALWQIRAAIETEDRRYLLTDDLTIAFAPQASYWLDVAILDRNLVEPAAEADPRETVQVYEGELLPGFYDEWLLPERERLEAIFERQMRLWLERLVEMGRWPEVLEWAERWIALGSTPEPAYRALLMAWASQGDLSQAAVVYQRCVEALGRELGVTPAEQTQALYDEIQSGRRQRQTPRHNLPEQLTSFLGRRSEIREVQQLLSANRLVTIIGPGGMGKTRLALRAAADLLGDYPDGVWFVTYAALADPALVTQTTAGALGIRGESARPILERLLNYLRSKQALLLLDNCEHLVDACARLAEALLQACPQLQILTTSREALTLSGEALYWIPALSLPEDHEPLSIESLSQSEAAGLFARQASLILPGFALTDDNLTAVAQVCRRLDGIPLAIELAAARVKLLSVVQIAARLDDRFRLLTGGSRTALPRYQTMRASIDWSYDLLSLAEQRLFRELSIFAGGWTLESAEAISNTPPAGLLDLLTQLVSKSLVVAENGPATTRYRFLETIREYARQALIESGEADKIRNRHLNCFLDLARQAKADIRGPREAQWRARLEVEIDNNRAALAWAQEHNVDAGLGLAGALWYFWDAHGYTRDGVGWLTQLLNRSAPNPLTPARAGALLALSDLYTNQNDMSQAQASAEEGLELYQRFEQEPGIALGFAVLGRALILQQGASSQRGRTLLTDSLALFRELDSKPEMAWVLAVLGRDNTDYQTGRQQLEESLSIFRSLGCMADVAAVLANLANIATQQGDLELAQARLAESLPIARRLNKSILAMVLGRLGDLALRQADYEQARRYCEECLTLSQEAGDAMHGSWTLVNLGYIALRQGERARARAIFEECFELFRAKSIQIGIVYVLEGLASLITPDSPARAAQLFAWADAMRARLGDPRPPIEQVSVDADLDSIRLRLDAPTLDSARARGRALKIDQAIDCALQTDL